MALTSAQITLAFQNVLQRDPSAAELSAWLNASTSGALTDAQVYAAIVNSAEAQNGAAAIIRVYQSAFGRVPDKAGLDQQTDSFVRGGFTINKIAEGFVVSQEFANRYNGGTLVVDNAAAVTDAFLQSLYQNVLGRAGSATEIAAWKATLTTPGSGYTKASDILIGFSQSPEFVGKAATAVSTFLTAAAQGTAVYSGALLDPALGAGTTFTLTTGADNFTGGANTDVFNSVDTTLTIVDQINGGAGDDRLNYTDTSNGGGLPGPAITSIEHFYIRNVETANAGETYDFSGITGETQVWSDRSTDSVLFDNLATGTTVGVNGDGATVIGDVTFQMATASDAVAIAIANGVGATGTAPAITENGSNGTATTATISSTGAANKVGTVDLANATLTKVTFKADANLEGDFLSQATDQVGANGAVTISGVATAVKFTAALDNTIKTIDASGLTAGGLEATVGTGTEDYKGGAGVDKITLNTGIKTATFGAGNDVVTTAAVNTTTAGAISGGDGTDTLAIAAGTDVDSVAKRAVYTGFETLQNNTTAAIAADGFTGITSVITNADGGGFTGLDATQAGAVTVKVDQSAVTYALKTATGTSDVLKVTLQNATATASADLASATVNGFETLEVTSSSGNVDETNAAANIVSFAAATNLTAIKLAGAFAVNLILDNTSKGVTVTNTLSGTAAMKVEGEVIKGTSITTTDNGDTIETALAAVAGVAGEFVTYSAGAGDDAISTSLTGLNNVDNGKASLKIDGGAGKDTLTFATADATFTDARFQHITNIENVTLANTTALTFTSGGFFDTNFKAAGVTLTTATLADAATATIDLASFTGAAKVVVTSSGVGDAAAEDLTINTGSGADDVSLTAASWTGAAGASSGITVGTGAGADKISLTIGNLLATTSGNIVVNGGTGADTITVSHTNDTTATALISFKIVDGDSTAAARDKITGFLKADGTDRSDVLDFDTANVAANTAGTNGTDSGAIKSHAIASGIITFDDVDTFAAALTINEANLTDVLSYLATNISTAGDTVAFAYDSNSDGTADATVVFNQGASDSVVELVGVTGVTAIGASAVTANLVAIG